MNTGEWGHGGTRWRLLASVAPIVLCAAACAPPQPLALPGRGGTPRQTSSSNPNRGPKQINMSTKRVAGKDPPTTFIAEDGTVCTATQKRFNETAVGDDAWCAWRVP